MRRAIALSEKSVKTGGGPFGAVIARGGVVVAEASNSVTIDDDPTAHAEVNAIRMACRGLKTFDLSGCDIYCSCEPCPMCLGAIYWARLDRVYYANDRKDAARIGFADNFIYDELMIDPDKRNKQFSVLLPEEGLGPSTCGWRSATKPSIDALPGNVMARRIIVRRAVRRR